MVLTLYIQDKNRGEWIVDNKRHAFDILPGEDSVLAKLDYLQLDFHQISGLILAVADATMTQVKVFTTLINTLAWNFDLPVTAKFYFSQNLSDILPDLQTELKAQKQFVFIEPQYRRNPDITLSKKPKGFQISK